jgi:hypothetical protein
MGYIRRSGGIKLSFKWKAAVVSRSITALDDEWMEDIDIPWQIRRSSAIGALELDIPHYFQCINLA